MAHIEPFRPFRYTAKAGSLEKLATQPYDTIPADLEAYYRRESPHNLVRLILPGRDYAGAAELLDEWVADGILTRDAEPALFVYDQSFALPGTGERLSRRGVIGLAPVEDYGRVIFRHERTLDAPKADRFELLRHTRAQFGSIFMAYPDPRREVDALLDEAAALPPAACFTDLQQTTHTLWRVDDAAWIARVQAAIEDKCLLIADGHHRYECALRYSRDEAAPAGARMAMMTFVNLHSPGLRTLAAHRLVYGLEPFPTAALLELARPLADLAALQRAWSGTPSGRVRFGVALPGGLGLIECDRPDGWLNLTVLHEQVLDGVLGIAPEAVTRQQFVRYRRGLEAAVEDVRTGAAQAAFLVEPLPVAEVARLAFAGRTLPQKSTDFYPKLHSGLTIYRMD